MKKILVTTLFFVCFFQANSQSIKEYYKDNLDCVLDLSQKSNDAFLVSKDYELGRNLFDSLVNSCIKGRYLSNYEFRTLKKRNINTDEFEKSILIVTSASWCAPCYGEIPTLNKVASKYSDKLQIIVLFADTKNKMKKMATRYDDKIILIPALNPPSDQRTLSISGFEHLLDFPTTYLIDTEKKILDISRGAAFPNDKMDWDEVNRINEKNLMKFLTPILNP
ncbi:TlpA family protein disulfide reductase [Ekhidna sp.]